ncbi:MAG: hypothetical protein CMP34_01445 [Rickettsiales bacterium]|nr:hypothetical protein [Rickettsiales bacterium]
MILKDKKRKHISDSINLIPMINIVFLLLIFFLLTGVISKKEPIKITKPFSLHGLQNESQVQDLSFTILGNQIFYNGKKITAEDFEELAHSKQRIILNIDKNVKILDFNKIIKILKKKEIKRIFVKVSEKEK